MVRADDSCVLADADEIRSRALAQLYKRRERLDLLIRELEKYQAAVERRTPGTPVSALEKCW